MSIRRSKRIDIEAEIDLNDYDVLEYYSVKELFDEISSRSSDEEAMKIAADGGLTIKLLKDILQLPEWADINRIMEEINALPLK